MNIEHAMKLAGGVLSVVHVSRHHQDYQDYKQELLILIFNAYNENPDVSLTENKLLFKFLKWRLIDRLRKNARDQEYVEVSEELPVMVFDEWEQCNLRSMFETYMSTLDKEDVLYQLMKLYLTKPGYLMNDYCKLLNIHRTTARRQFDRIKEEFKVLQYDK